MIDVHDVYKSFLIFAKHISDHISGHISGHIGIDVVERHTHNTESVDVMAPNYQAHKA